MSPLDNPFNARRDRHSSGGDEAARARIDALAGAFYRTFDNRRGRRAEIETLRSLFAAEATITRLGPSSPLVMDVTGFIEPRAELLRSGRLVDFHEWETASDTVLSGSMAVRVSAYSKEGWLEGSSYAGSGRKIVTWYRDGDRWLIASLLWEDD